MATSRRELMQVLGAGAAVLATAGHASDALAQAAVRLDLGAASNAERELRIVNFETLEEEARKILHPARFAFMGPAGEGITYRENRRAFNDYPIMPRRLPQSPSPPPPASALRSGESPNPNFTSAKKRLPRFVATSAPTMKWPPAFVVVRSYLDQLVRNQGLAAARTTAIAAALDAAEAKSGAARKSALTALAAQVDVDVKGAKDGQRVQWMSDAIKKLAAQTK